MKIPCKLSLLKQTTSNWEIWKSKLILIKNKARSLYRAAHCIWTAGFELDLKFVDTSVFWPSYKLNYKKKQKESCGGLKQVKEQKSKGMTQMFLSKFNVSGSSTVFLWHDLSCRVRWKKWAGSSSGFICEVV